MSSGKIERIELFHIDAPLPTPLFPVWIPGYPQYRQRHTLLAVTTRDGLTGYATGVAFDREREGLGDFIGQFLLGVDPYDVELASEALRQSAYLGWRNSWMELAFWDLAAKKKGVPLHELLSEKLALPAEREAPSVVEPYASFWEMRSPEVRAEGIERALRMGFKGVKINVCAAEEAENHRKVRLARQVAGPSFRILAHARQAWSISLVERIPRWDLARALRFAEVAAEERLEWLQEPLPSESWDDLSELSKKAGVPIAGGDITLTIFPFQGMIERRCQSVLTPDAAFAGLSNVVRTMALCRANRLSFSPSSNSDGLGLTANVHALVAWSRVAKNARHAVIEFPWEPPALIPEHRDVLLKEPLLIRPDGMLPVPTGPGLGVEIDAKALRRYGRRFYTVTPVRFVASSARRSGLRQTAELTTKKQGKRRTRDKSGARANRT